MWCCGIVDNSFQGACTKCRDLKPLYTPEQQQVEGTPEEEEEVEVQVMAVEAGGGESESDDSGEEEEGEEEDEDSSTFPPGSVVWARTRSWYAGQVMGAMDLPDGVKRTLARSTDGSVVVRRFVFDDFKVIRPDRLDSLGENRVDRARAAVSDQIGAGYDMALGVINGDI